MDVQKTEVRKTQMKNKVQLILEKQDSTTNETVCAHIENEAQQKVSTLNSNNKLLW